MRFTLSFIATFLVLGLSTLVGHSARVTSTSHEELEKRDREGQGEEEWDEEDQPWKENGEVDAGGDEEMQEDADGEMAPLEGDNEEGFPPQDDMPSDDEPLNTKAVSLAPTAPTPQPTPTPTAKPTPPPTPEPTPKPTAPTPYPTPENKWGNIIRGVSYGPMPLKKLGGKLAHDDFWESDAAAMWRDRGDLKIIAALGANAVRLYGNHALKDHREFLDESEKLGLQVIPGMSDYPYTQMGPPGPANCVSTKLNCYEQVKDSYIQNLKNGGFLRGNRYHPALRRFIIINEPDLKMGGGNPKQYTKALISAFDGVLAAEKELNVDTTPDGNPLNFTVTYSFSMCKTCEQFKTKPTVGQMWHFRDGCRNPGKYGYTPKNDIREAFRTRFEFSFNAFNPSWQLPKLFLDAYNGEFQGTPVFLGEYHNEPFVPKGGEPGTQQRDIEGILEIAKNSMLAGISFFEFQVREDKGGSEMAFGMFKLGDTGKKFKFEGEEVTAFCLKKQVDKKTNEVIPDVLAKAYGGRGLSEGDFPQDSLC